MNATKLNILIAEDEPAQVLLLTEIMTMLDQQHQLHFVEDGEALLEYLNGRRTVSNRQAQSLPDLILLDLNLPKKDGREALKVLKSHATFKHIPVIVMSTSNAPFDIEESYLFGASAYICKPYDFSAFLEAIRTILAYWSQVVTLPERG